MSTNPHPGPLAALTAEQKQQLLAWLELHPVSEVLEKAAAPPPDGFGIRTWPTTLRRFYARHRVSTVRENADLATDLLSVSDQVARFDTATAESLRQTAFELANAPGNGLKHFRAVSRWILKIRQQQQQSEALALARERLALDREKFQFNAARHALLHHAQLTAISADPAMDNQDKISAARDLIFGQPATANLPAPHAAARSTFPQNP